MKRVEAWTAQKTRARTLPASMPFSTREEEDLRKTLTMARSVMPRDFSIPIVEMFSNRSISSPETMLKPATTVIRARMNITLKSMSASQSKSWGFSSAEETATTDSSSSEAYRRDAAPISRVISSIPDSERKSSSRDISKAETLVLSQPFTLCISSRRPYTTSLSSASAMSSYRETILNFLTLTFSPTKYACSTSPGATDSIAASREGMLTARETESAAPKSSTPLKRTPCTTSRFFTIPAR